MLTLSERNRKNKRGQLAGGLVAGIIGFVFLVVIGFVMVSQLLNSNLLTAGTAESNSAGNLSANMSAGVNVIAAKVVTFFTIIAAVIIIGYVLLLWRQYQASKVGGGNSGGL